MHRCVQPERLAVARPIVLVGMMGSGKTTIGKRLAARLRVPFVDADDEIELAAGLTIPEIFSKLGEPAFREGERRVIARLVTESPCVISTGGGAIVTAETRNLLLQQATTIWLDAPLDVLVERTSRRNNRPLLHTADPALVLARLLEVRAPLYAQAAIHISSARQPHEKTVEAILAALARQGPAA
jgi:shikimate kinase